MVFQSLRGTGLQALWNNLFSKNNIDVKTKKVKLCKRTRVNYFIIIIIIIIIITTKLPSIMYSHNLNIPSLQISTFNLHKFMWIWRKSLK